MNKYLLSDYYELGPFTYIPSFYHLKQPYGVAIFSIHPTGLKKIIITCPETSERQHLKDMLHPSIRIFLRHE